MPFKPTLILSRAQLLPWSWAGTGISPILSSSCKQIMGQTLNLKLKCAECSFWCFLRFSVKSYHHSMLLYWQHCSTEVRRVHDTYKQLIRKYHSLIPMSTCSSLHIASSLSKTLRPCRLEKGTTAICWFCPSSIQIWYHKLVVLGMIQSPQGSPGSGAGHMTR